MKNQRGLTLIGFLIVAILLVFALIAVAKVLPAYLDYWSVKKVLAAMGNDPELPDMSLREVQASFERRADIDYVAAVNKDDLIIRREGGKVVEVSVEYADKRHLVGPMSVCMDFFASSNPQAERPDGTE
jgi:Domain of unknown function (DUF4845)